MFFWGQALDHEGMNVVSSRAVEVASGTSQVQHHLLHSFLVTLVVTISSPSFHLVETWCFPPPDFSFCPDVASLPHKEIMQVSEGVPLSHLRCLASLGYVNARYCKRRLPLGLSFSEAHVAILLTHPHLLPLLWALLNLSGMCRPILSCVWDNVAFPAVTFILVLLPMCTLTSACHFHWLVVHIQMQNLTSSHAAVRVKWGFRQSFTLRPSMLEVGVALRVHQVPHQWPEFHSWVFAQQKWKLCLPRDLTEEFSLAIDSFTEEEQTSRLWSVYITKYQQWESKVHVSKITMLVNLTHMMSSKRSQP